MGGVYCCHKFDPFKGLVWSVLATPLVPFLLSSLPFGVERAATMLPLKKCKTKGKLWLCKGFANNVLHSVGHFDELCLRSLNYGISNLRHRATYVP